MKNKRMAGIILLFIPLIIFIAVEGIIIYNMILMVTNALFSYGFSLTATVDGEYRILPAMGFALLLAAAVAVLIGVYIKFVIRVSIRDKRRKKEEKFKDSANSDNSHVNSGKDGGNNG
jgi:cytochrome b subunit of formate dehydrogenase